MTTLSVEERVQRGAALLDEKFPGWVDHVELQTLSLSSPCQCILGQRFGDFADGAIEIGMELTYETDYHDSPGHVMLEEHGFLVNPRREAVVLAKFGATWGNEEASRIAQEYRTLTEEWVKLITDRRAQAQLAELPAYALEPVVI